MKLLSFFLFTTAVFAGAPIHNLSVTLRGKKFDVEEATTVKDVLGQIKTAAGVDGRLLISGQQLKETDNLEDLGVKDGASLQMVPKLESTKKKKSKKTTSSKTSAAAKVGSSSSTKEATTTISSGGMPNVSDLLKSGEGMPNMEESMDMMQNMINSPMLQEYMKDPEKIEAARQMILSNPMIKQMMGGMPGMKEILEDKDAWREAMTAVANMYKNMDPETLKSMMDPEAMKSMMGSMDPEALNSMMGSMGGNSGLGGLFGGGTSSTDADKELSSLDELSEDDE